MDVLFVIGVCIAVFILGLVFGYIAGLVRGALWAGYRPGDGDSYMQWRTERKEKRR